MRTVSAQAGEALSSPAQPVHRAASKSAASSGLLQAGKHNDDFDASRNRTLTTNKQRVRSVSFIYQIN